MEDCLRTDWSQLELMLAWQNASPCGVDVNAGDGPDTQSIELDHVQAIKSHPQTPACCHRSLGK